MKKTVLLCCFICTSLYSYCQDLQQEYHIHIKQGDSLYKIKAYKAGALQYSKAFESLGWKGKVLDRYNAACLWALAGVPDSAFFQLFKIASLGDRSYKNYEHIIGDADLFPLHNDKRWKPLLEMIKTNKEKAAVKEGVSQQR